MNNIDRLIEQLSLTNNLKTEDIPKVELYVDQVLQLFESSFSAAKRHDKEKVLTKTMINNYAKGKLFFPVRNKKYSPEHLMLISLIYQLKGTLAISDIKTVLEGISEQTANGTFDLTKFYEKYLKTAEDNAVLFSEELRLHAEKTVEQAPELPEGEEAEDVLLIASLVQMSNLYRKAAERLVDELAKKRASDENGDGRQ